MAYASKEIENFIENFPDEAINAWYDYSQYQGEMADFLRGVYEVKPELCLAFYARQESNKCFEIAHPTHNHIRTRAVYSAPIHKSWVNTIFFIDENNQYPWVYVYAIDLHVIITPESVFNFHTDFGLLPSLSLIQSLLKGKENELRFREISWAFSLHKRYPMHYFWETLPVFMALNTNKNILDAPSYFIPKKYWDKKSKDEVYFTINGIGFWQLLKENLMPEYMKDCAERVYKESMQDFDSIVKKEDGHYNLVLWLSLTSSFWGRQWMEQIEGFLNIIQEFAKSFKNIKIYYDGFTSYEPVKIEDFHSNASEVEAEFLSRFNELNLNDRVKIISLDGLNFREKICYCSMVDIAFCEPGSASIVPSFISQKPCVLFGDSRLWFVPLTRPVKLTKAVSGEFVMDCYMIDYKEGGGPSEPTYHIPWQHIYNLAAEILEELFKSRGQSLYLYRLQVPSVRLVAKEYELLQKQKELGLKPDECLNSNDNQKANTYFIDFVANEWVKKEDYIKNLEDKNANLNTQLNILEDKINSVAEQSAAEELKIKKLQVKELEKKLGLKLSKLEPRVVLNLNESLKTSAVARVRNHLAYRLGAAMIVCSKSLFGLCSLPFVLSFIKVQYKKEQAAYKALITQRPQLKLPELENYADFKAALNEKECFTYKLGLAFIKACKTWYKGGFVKFYFKVKRLEREFKEKRSI